MGHLSFVIVRALKNAHLPAEAGFLKLKRRCAHPSSLRRMFMYASFLRISCALHLSIFHHPADVFMLVLIFRPYIAFGFRYSFGI
jgi:hypothetical protein